MVVRAFLGYFVIDVKQAFLGYFVIDAEQAFLSYFVIDVAIILLNRRGLVIFSWQNLFCLVKVIYIYIYIYVDPIRRAYEVVVFTEFMADVHHLVVEVIPPTFC